MKHDKYCPNKADVRMTSCTVCVLIRKVRADEYEIGFRAGYVKGRNMSADQRINRNIRG